MRQSTVKIILALFVFLLLDLARPFDYSIYTEFLFLGIIFLFLNFPFILSVVLAVIFGYLKDTLSYSSTGVYLIEFLCMSILARYVLARLDRKAAMISVLLGSIIIHIVINSVYNGVFIFFSLIFCIQSLLVFFLINYLLSKWIKTSAAESI